MNSEPVGLAGAVTAALTATMSLLLFLDVDPELVAGITAALAAWVVVATVWVRSRVTPTADPTLTSSQAARLHVTPDTPPDAPPI